MTRPPTLRVARPTNQLSQIARMYCEGLECSVLASFTDHDGFDGTIVGRPGEAYHLEFTRRRGRGTTETPDGDHLLVFYEPDSERWEDCCSRLVRAGFRVVRSVNPFWDRQGRTFEDLDGYRIVVQNSEWRPETISRRE